MSKKALFRLGVLAVLTTLIISLLALPFLFQEYEAEAAPPVQNVACYFEQGGAKFVASSGCEIEVQSGGIFDLQSGATIDFSSGVDLDGADLTIDADGDSILDENTDDNIRLTLGTAAGTFSTLTGNFKVGNGSPTVAQNGEDAYVEGQFEVDGEGQFDGGIDSNGIIDQDGAADAVQLAVTGYTTQTTDLVQLDGGLTDIGGGTYSVANGDNDLGVAGDIEATGNVVFGADDLYPLGYASADQQVVCGTTSTFTDSTSIDVTALTTATYVVASQVTAPITTAAFLQVSDPTTTSITLTSLNSTFGTGTTGIQAHYCVVGDQ